jgi:hypothetical protein
MRAPLPRGPGTACNVFYLSCPAEPRLLQFLDQGQGEACAGMSSKYRLHRATPAIASNGGLPQFPRPKTRRFLLGDQPKLSMAPYEDTSWVPTWLQWVEAVLST